jgi:hypothetical protein
MRPSIFLVLLASCNAEVPATTTVPAPIAMTCTRLSRPLDDATRTDVYALMRATESAWSTFHVAREREGEDATSGFDTVRLSDATGLRLERVVWNGGAQSLPTVRDTFHRDGKPVVVVERVIPPNAIGAWLRGPVADRSTQTSLVVLDSTGAIRVWLDGLNDPVSATCERWREREASVR